MEDLISLEQQGDGLFDSIQFKVDTANIRQADSNAISISDFLSDGQGLLEIAQIGRE